MVTTMYLPTGGVSVRAYIRVPRRSPYSDMWGMKDRAGSVHCNADLWEGVIVDFAGIAASVISQGPDAKTVCAGDVYFGLETIRKLARTDQHSIIDGIRRELLALAYKITSNKLAVIDLTATAMLLASRRNGRLRKELGIAPQLHCSARFTVRLRIPVPTKATDIQLSRTTQRELYTLIS
jgi:hypothetical protein